MKKGYNKSKTASTKGYLASDGPYIEKPSLRIEEDELPAIKDWKIDGEYTLELKVKLMSLGKSDYDKNPKIWASFRVESVSEDNDADEGAGDGGN